MNEKIFAEAMNMVDDRYYEEALNYRPKHKRQIWIKWGAIAACLAVTVYAGAALLHKKAPGNIQELPMLTVSEDAISAMGFEGYMAFDISELADANPWNDFPEISVLPVYRNPLTYNEDRTVPDADFSKMRVFLLDIAVRLGLDTEKITISDDVPDEETQQKIAEKFQSVGETVPEGYFAPTRLIIEADGLKIEVDRTMTAKISFEPAVSLPDEYNFSHFSSYEDTAAAAEYLKEEYRELIAFDSPQKNIYGGDYNIYLQQGYLIEFFDAGGSNTDRIINYNFNRVAFYCDDDDKLFLARVFKPDLSDKVGDYPIITPERAGELLSDGYYSTSVPYEMPGAEYVKKAELIYRTGEYETYYMPYYRFYVELPEEERENGLKTYGAYYVPAVDKNYISNMPIWNGSYN